MGPRLKSVEMQGYKTFANRVVFKFPQEITSVVGPNGSGKSNIADAIRWVLGEQSYSLLRGRKTEDMIFSGSQQRSRAGMAYVTITFDNEDGWLPLDFTEVSITRRAYRDGQNEYLLNGSRVRLKEISELLATTGLGQRTYTIIGQGLVDTALSIKPEERRKFFEDAAGIGLYRNRKVEALNRLTNTQRNLERILDILSELKPRLRSLERQARKAKEYEQVKADLNILLREWYGYHWHQKQHDLTSTRDDLQKRGEQLVLVREQMEIVDLQTKNSQKNIRSLRDRLNQWHLDSANLHRKREEISRNLAVTEERQRSLSEQHNTVEIDLTKLQEEQSVREDRILRIVEEVKELRQEFESATSHLTESKKNLEKRQGEREVIRRQLNKLRGTQSQTEANKVRTKAQISELENRIKELSFSRDGIEKQIQELIVTSKSAQKAFDEISNELEEIEEQKNILQRDFNAIQTRISDHEGQSKIFHQQRTTLETDNAKLKVQLRLLEEADESFSGLNQGAKFVLKEAKNKKINKDLAPLSSVLDVPIRFEKAISAVLGEHIDAVIYEDPDLTEQFFTILENGENGRAIFLPANISRKKIEKSFVENENCFGLASKLVKAPQKFDAVVEHMLGNALIVKDRTEAKKYLDAETNLKIVTLAGEIFWGEGCFIAGHDKRTGIIARPRQKREMQNEIQKIEKQLSEVIEKEQDNNEQLAQLENLEKEAKQNLNQKNQESSNLDSNLNKARLNLEQVKQKIDFQKNQIQKFAEQITRAVDETSNKRNTLKEIELIIQRTENEIKELSRSLHTLPMDELQSQVTHWTTNIAVVERALKDCENRHNEYKLNFQKYQDETKVTQGRLKSISRQLQEINSEKFVLRSQEAEINEDVDGIQKKIKPAEENLQDLEKQYSQLQETQVSTQQSVNSAERISTQAQMEVARKREALETLRRKIEDDFGLVAFEYQADVMGPTPLPFGDMVKELPVVKEISEEIDDNITRHRGQLRRIGAVNLEAQTEYNSVKERHDFLENQIEDLKNADQDLRKIIAELDDLMKIEFLKTFNAVAVEFKKMFTRLFGGGSAKLVLMDEENPIDTGVEIQARLPGRREQGLALLSGGERSLTAVALIFSLLKVSPTPFSVLDEVDAALDEANVVRFAELLRELSQDSQFVVITHNRNTVQSSDVIYGVTMSKESVSQVISLKMDEVSSDMLK
ncbi:MAG: chromosome segregation protein SMC [Anaerolineaceae bacterium]|nr:chromosome segregation protein SMC [Anaerolineaceae bacterium]